MKRCPECGSIFEELYRYCDLDGTPLVEAEPSPTDQNLKAPPGWKILSMGAIAGLAIGVVLFVIYHRLTREVPPEATPPVANASVGPVLPPMTLQAETAFASPSPESSPSPSPSPSPSVSPSPRPSPTVQLSSSPISTGATADTRVRIRLTNGAIIDADEAWKGPEGIWYRQQGVVALIDPSQVKSVERPPPAASPSPAK